MGKRKGRFIQLGLGDCPDYEGLTLHQILVWEYLRFRMEDGYLKGKQPIMAADLHMDKSTFARAAQKLVELGKMAQIKRKKDHMIYRLSDDQEPANTVSQEVGFADTANTDTANTASYEDNKNNHLQEVGFAISTNPDIANPPHETANAISPFIIGSKEPSKNPSPTPSKAEEEEGRKDSIYFRFKDAPPIEVRTELKAAGLGWHGSGGYWYGQWTPERQALWDKHQSQFGSIDHGTPPAGNGQSIASAPDLPETYPALRPLFEELRSHINTQRYETWIAPLTATIEDDQVTVWCPSIFTADQIKSRYRTQIEASATALLGREIRLEILSISHQPKDQ